MEIPRPNVRILMIEDNPGDVYLVRRALAETTVDCDLRVLADGDQITNFVIGDEPAPDVILLDFHVPKMSGGEALTILRGRYPNARIFVFTSSESPRDKAEVAELGAEYLAKPRGLDEYLQVGRFIAGATKKTGQ